MAVVMRLHAVHPDGVEHEHAGLVLLDPCKERDLLRGLQDVHVPIHHLLHRLHVVVDLPVTPSAPPPSSAAGSASTASPAGSAAASESAPSRPESTSAAPE